MKVYFAHPMRTYNTPEEEKIVKALRKEGWEVVNPKDYLEQARELTAQAGGGWLDCSVCREKVMKPLFYELLSKCEVFVYWNPLDTCGVECEADLARDLNKVFRNIRR